MKKVFMAGILVCLSSAYSLNSDIRFNSLGFLPLQEKQASVAASCTTFEVRRVSDNSVAYSGAATGPVWNPDTSENIYTIDFTPLHESGSFYIEVPGVGTSYNFDISYDV